MCTCGAGSDQRAVLNGAEHTEARCVPSMHAYIGQTTTQRVIRNGGYFRSQELRARRIKTWMIISGGSYSALAACEKKSLHASLQSSCLDNVSMLSVLAAARIFLLEFIRHLHINSIYEPSWAVLGLD
jgi:hypothetical protein